MTRLDTDINSEISPEPLPKLLPRIMIVNGSSASPTYGELLNDLLSNDRYQIKQIEINQTQSTELVLAVCELDKLDLPDCILIDWESCDRHIHQIVKKLTQQLDQSHVSILILGEAKNKPQLNNLSEDLTQAYLVKETLTIEFLDYAIVQAIAQSSLAKKLADAGTEVVKHQSAEAENKLLKQRLQLEQAVNLLIQSIHSSFDLSTIFTAATTGVGKLLNLDRVEINQYLPHQGIWIPMVEYRDNETVSTALGLKIHAQDNLLSSRLRQGEIICVNSSGEVGCNIGQILAPEYSGSWLITPLIVGTEIWGTISMISDREERLWQNREIDLANNISTQVAIAIQQSISRSQLHEEISARKQAEIALKQFNQQLELTIIERTAALQASETRFREFFDFATIGIAVAEAHSYKFVAVNNAFCQLLGYSERELLEIESGLTISDSADWARERPYAKSMIRGEINSYQIDKRYLKKNGEYILTELTATLIKGGNGNVSHLVSMVRDITKQREAELALKENNRFIQQIADASPNILYLYDLQTQQSVYANSGVFNILGYSVEQVYKMGVKLFPTVIYEEDFAKIHTHFEQLVHSENGEILEVEYRAIHANGNIKYLLSRNTIFSRDSNGMAKQIIGTAQDISDRKKTELELLDSQNKLSQSEELLRLTIENTPVGICTFDLEADFLTANKDMCQIYGYSREEFLQKNMLLLTHPDYVKSSLAGISQLIAGTERSIRLEHQYIHKSGKIIEAISRVSLVKDAGGNPSHFVASIEDITEQKNVAIALKQRMERQEFLMNITQQIRQSLNLDQVLETAVNEVKRLLDCDRVIIFQLFEGGVTKVVKEAVNSNFPTIINRHWLDEHFTEVGFEHYINSTTRIVNDVSQDTWASCLSEFMHEAQVKSKIVAPIIQHIKASKERPSDQIQPTQVCRWEKDDYRLWGLLIAHSCGKVRQWKPDEAELLQQIANQLAIAIQQADLYQQAQNEIIARKKIEKELIIQAAADRLLSEVTVVINQSINVDEALDLILKKVQQFLKCDRILIYQLDHNRQGCVIKEEVSRPDLSILGNMINDTCFATTNLVDEYLQDKITTLSDVHNSPTINPCYAELLEKFQVKANIAASIIHSYQLWGLLLVHQCDSSRVWLSAEVNLVKQVAAQIGISAQKERLYQHISSELTQKKILLKEIHHRVKNNLQVMSSILYLQFRNTPPEIKLLTEEFQNRIYSMALIHDQLHRGDNLSDIGFHNYITNLTSNLFQCYGINPELIQLEVKIEDLYLTLDQSIPLGLIVNELISNALKYAFPNHYGKIVIELIKLNTRSEQKLILTVSDNGIGIPKSFDLKNAESTGMQLVQSLTDQLEGEFYYDGEDGSLFQITFPLV